MATDVALPTDEEFLRVRSFECRVVHGHLYEVLVEGDDPNKPRAITCLHCGQTWPVFNPRAVRSGRSRRSKEST